MLISVFRLTILLLLIGVTTAVAQEPKKKPESISTEPKLATATIKMGDGATIEIKRHSHLHASGISARTIKASLLVREASQGERWGA